MATIHRDHVYEWHGCWCNYRVEQMCPICSDDAEAKASCGHCDGVGWVAEFTDDPEWPTITIHEGWIAS